MLLSLADRVRPLRRSEFDRLVELGVFRGERLELIEGAIINMGPQGGAHASTITRMNRLLARRLSASVDLRVQMPFAASDQSEPEPDLAVVAAGDYEQDHPTKALLIIEVSDSSLTYDRTIKARLYAEARVPEYWVVDLQTRCVEVHRDPRHGKYVNIKVARPGDTLRLLSVARVSLAVSDFFAKPSRN